MTVVSPSLSLTLQYAAIAVAVIASAWVVLNKQFPAFARRLRIAIALPLVREGRPAWLRRLAKRIAPAPRSGADACRGCNSCDPGGSA